MGTEFEKESSLLEPVRRHLYRKGVRHLESELQFFDYRLDVYGYSKACDSTFAVELKLKRWRRAFEQALIYQLCADFVSLALPATGASLVDADLLRKHGIGLISVQSARRCIRLIEPAQSRAIRPGYRRFYVDLVQGRQVCP